MNIETVGKNEDHRIFYKEELLRLGADIRFSAWNQGGVPLFVNQSATQEISNSGVYYFDFTTPNTDGYLLVLSTDGNQPRGTILQIGSPTIELSFYLRGDLDPNKTVEYEIYNESSTTLSIGTMDSVVSGFYSVNVSAYSANKPWFLRVVELVYINQ